MTAEVGGRLDVAQLRNAIEGAVITPDDEGYEEARVVLLGGVDARPAVIVKVAGVDDVAEVIALARVTGLELAVRAGGHSGAAHSTVEGGIVLDVRDLQALEIDVAGRTAWVGAGLTAGAVTSALAEHGLAVGFGDTGSVGVAGITLGGGIGYLVRKHGMTIDSLLAVELVTAAGDVLVVDAQTHPDLFWAVRGGGGNFGVATRFRFRLQSLPGVVGGMAILPATVDSITGYVAAAASAPEGLTVIANVMPCPPMPFVPEEHHGEMVLFALVCWSGDAAEADAALAPLRAVAEPLADMIRPMSYAEMYPPEDADYHPLAVARNLFMDAFDEADARTMLDALAASDAPMRVVQLRPLGGAMARVPADATAFAHRDRAFMASVASFYTGPEDLPAREAWVEDLTAALRDGTGAYVNFLADEGPERVHDAYPAGTYERLATIKARYDPENLFRRNQNVPPSFIRPMTLEANKEIARRFIEEVFGGRPESVGELVAPDFVGHSWGEMPPGRAPLLAAMERVNAGLSDHSMSIDDMIAEGDRVAVRLHSHARQTGTFMGLPASGRDYTISETHVFRIANGMVAEHWRDADMLGLMQQLGAIPGPDAKR